MSRNMRRSAWQNGGTFANDDLLWYARGVGIMQSRSLDDPSSWWFFAAIHGEEIATVGFPGWGSLPAPPAVPTSPLPAKNVQDLFWNQCQHQSWYFAPWHRGYLIALEAQLRAAIVSIDGPTTWSLPYWNYLEGKPQSYIPPAFTQATLPDGSPNPLAVAARYGPNLDGQVYVEVPPASDLCQSDTVYTGSNLVTPPPGYGGPETGFSNSGNVSGRLESNPHNLVHLDVGGVASPVKYGLMADPGLAALDPIFYLHHANIDRMWAAWNAAGNRNPSDPTWLAGPSATGERSFAMPMPDGTTWKYRPQDVDDLSKVDYVYDDIGMPTIQPAPAMVVADRIARLGGSPLRAADAADVPVTHEENAELIGASEEPMRVVGGSGTSRVVLDSAARSRVAMRLRMVDRAIPDQVILKLENVRSTVDAHKLSITVNDTQVGVVSLFGVRRASQSDSMHAGQGITFILDVTGFVDAEFLRSGLDIGAVDVRVTPKHQVSEQSAITVERVSLYRIPTG